MDLKIVILLAIAGVALYYGSQFLFARSTAMENRRRWAIDASQWCAANGLPGLSKLLSHYAVGDRSGTLWQLRELRRLLAQPEELQEARKRFLRIQLDKQLDTAEGREELIQFVESKFDIKLPREVLSADHSHVLVEEAK
jgi:hypothetical protein